MAVSWTGVTSDKSGALGHPQGTVQKELEQSQFPDYTQHSALVGEAGFLVLKANGWPSANFCKKKCF